MSTSIWMQRLNAIRRASFIGRDVERDLFLSTLSAEQPSYFVLYFYGPGGIGKTTLLRQLSYLASQNNYEAIYLDSRNLEPSPQMFLAVLQRHLDLDPDVSPVEFWANSDKRYVLLIDTYELLRPLDDWLRETFLPGLPGNILVVLAGRIAPSAGWRADPAWQSLMVAAPLRNLSSTESMAYLKRRDIPESALQGVVEFTHGHPLALSLVADLHAQRGIVPGKLGDAKDMIRLLVERLVQEAPGPLYRSALEASALVRVTTESLLAALLDADELGDVFAWLRGLSLMDVEVGGLFPHDMAREALLSDVRWRKPDWYVTLHTRARTYYLNHLMLLESRDQRRLLSDFIFLHRENPMVRPYFEWQSSGEVFTDEFTVGDQEAVVAMVAQHEGQESADIARYWTARQPDGISILRGSGNELAGVMFKVAMQRCSAEDIARDPAVAAVWNYLQRPPTLRKHERATLFRFWMARDTYQAVSPVQSRIFLNMVQHYLTTSSLAHTFLPVAEPAFWSMVFLYADLRLVPEMAFTVGERQWSMYTRDWRVSPPLDWLALMGDRELTDELPEPPPIAETPVLLTEDEFAEAVRNALRQLNDTLGLQNNVLLHTRLIRRQDDVNPVETLRTTIMTVVDALQATPRQRRLYRALYHTYVQPAPNQQAAAELLDLPFSTYRRHLKQGVEHVTGQLWLMEQAV